MNIKERLLPKLQDIRNRDFQNPENELLCDEGR
jgi:hypothetical protein